MLRLTRAGRHTQKQIASMLGIVQSTVSVIQRKAGMGPGQGTWNQDPKKTKRIARLLASGKSQAEIAEALGTSRQLVNYYAKNIRRKGEAQWPHR